MQTRRQGAKAPMKKTCQLDDTPDEDGQWIYLPSSSLHLICLQLALMTGISFNAQENEVNAVKPGRKSKRKDGARAGHGGKKGLSKRQKVYKSAGNTASQESPPIFVFKTSKTSFRKRKQLKLEKQLDEDDKNKKRIEDLVAYFKNLDNQKLETA
ncbi:hypothetical protein JG688_00000204 [Phytophthora aleatoria]|uniref:Uncharacterized protein n=1 Tax=Phytophthora aleatoria TaxID=2496075 RepID=A0A8J5ME11_9STRA|nr:hypothetical protein JG688_00000204 [Phytophthora aleatoria]